MTQITDDSVAAFCEGRTFKRSNMEVYVSSGWIHLYQHGNLIAQRPVNGGLYRTHISNAGWWSVTTQARLDALLQRVTMGAWGLYSDRGEWVLHSRKHGEHPTFKGSVAIQDLIDLDTTIANEREKRAVA